MKALKYIFMAATLGVSVSSCYDLDLEPKGLVTEDILMSNEDGMLKYLTLLYQELPIEDFNYKQNKGGEGYASVNAQGWHKGDHWEAQKGSPAVCALEATGWGSGYGVGSGWAYWPYDRIRDINNLLSKLELYRDNYSEKAYNELLGEVHFLRAFYYFGIVKRYGGVPLVDKVLDPLHPEEALDIVRSTEYDSWKFIYEDLKFAIENCTTDKSDKSRATRYSAAALMSRAMLYAGTNAKYSHNIATTGPAVDAGLMIMPSEKAQEFFQYAYDAAKIVEEGGYALHNGPDKEKACVEAMMTENVEDIMVKYFGTKVETPFKSNLSHLWDCMVLPLGNGLSSNVGGCMQPTYELASLYELPPLWDEKTEEPIRYNSVDEFWQSEKMEPRAKATIFFSGMIEPLSGTKLDILSGVYKHYEGSYKKGTPYDVDPQTDFIRENRVISDTPNDKMKFDGYPEEVKVTGLHGRTYFHTLEGLIHTGMCVRKYVTISGNAFERGAWDSHQPWKVFRYAEVLLNKAEAAYELGLLKDDESLKREAINIINQIRERAGAHLYSYKSNPQDIGTPKYGFAIDENLQFIRDERGRELAFENHRMYDIRRWRTADVDLLNGVYTRTIQPYYVLDEGKYIFLNEVDRQGTKVTFLEKWYYDQLPSAELAKNPKLIRNDGY